MTKGKLLTPEQSIRLAIVSAVDREKLLKSIVDEMRARERVNERRTARFRGQRV